MIQERLKTFLSFLLPILLLSCGMYLVPLNILNHDLSMIPGDLGDSRFNNYILEHGYKFISGKADTFWNAPFMYPYPCVIALSDNLLGTLPIYSLFRLFRDRETAFQLWILALYALNYIFCFIALKKWSRHILLSSVGAYIYAFSIFTVSQLYHVQVLPRFILPMVLYWCWMYFKELNVKHFLFLMLGICYQFYCGVYLGFLMLYVILFFFVSYFIIYRNFQILLQFKNIKTAFKHLLIVASACGILVPLMLPYWRVAKIMGMRKFENAISTIPQLRSYFFTSPASKTWFPILYKHSAYGFTDWWNHFLFIGALPWIAVLALPFVFFSKQILPVSKKLIVFLALTLFLCFIFCLNINGITLYRLIFMIPGFSSMRSIDRIINTEVILFVLIFVFVFKELSESRKTFRLLILSFPILIIIDNLIEPTEIKRYSKEESKTKIQETKQLISNQYNNKFAAFEFMPLETFIKDPDAVYYKTVETQVTVMLAAQELNIPCVNGYTGFYPGNYESLFYTLNDQTLGDWCSFSKGNIEKIQRINELGLREKYRKRVHLKTATGKFFSVLEGSKSYVIADKDNANSWETFTLIYFENGDCLLKANTNLFFSAQLDGNGEISASQPKANSWETFRLIDLGEGWVAFKAGNQKYICFDSATGHLFANSDIIKNESSFLIVKE